MVYNSLAQVQDLLASKKLSCSELVDHYLQNIARQNSVINAFLEVFEGDAKQQAALIDERLSNGKAGKLAGLVIGLKDNLCYKNHKVSASSKILQGFESIYSATVVERLLKEDAIIIGRLNCDEFAMGSSNENSAYGNVLNPIDNSRVPGGSSGGSASAVAANMCLATLGTDTGGSIRQPASFCGVVGLKPTYGRVSRYGCIAYASSFDQIGPITKNIEDAAAILEVIAGADEYDATVSAKKVESYLQKVKEFDATKPLKIAVLKDCIENKALDTEIRQKIDQLIQELKQKGHTVDFVDFPYLDYLVPTYYVLTTAEASSNLARYDGVHFGYRSPNATDLESTYIKSRTEGFGTEVKRRIMLGTFVLSAGYYDAYYSKGQKVRRLIQNYTNKLLADYNFILTPSTPKTAFHFGDNKDPIAMYLEDIYTVQANLVGIPAISIPFAQHSNGMPFGVQLMAKPFAESELLGFANTLINK